MRLGYLGGFSCVLILVNTDLCEMAVSAVVMAVTDGCVQGGSPGKVLHPYQWYGGLHTQTRPQKKLQYLKLINVVVRWRIGGEHCVVFVFAKVGRPPCVFMPVCGVTLGGGSFFVTNSAQRSLWNGVSQSTTLLCMRQSVKRWIQSL